MRKKAIFKKVAAVILASAMVVTSVLVPQGSDDVAYAAGAAATNGTNSIDVVKSEGFGFWNAGNKVSSELTSIFPESGQTVQYIFTAAGANCALLLESGGDGNWFRLNVSADAFGEAVDFGEATNDEKYPNGESTAFIKDHTYTVTLSNDSGNVTLAVKDLDTNSVCHTIKCSIKEGSDIAGKELRWIAENDIFYTAKPFTTVHNFSRNTEKSVATTCTQDGKNVYTCNDESCNYEYSYTMDALGHKYTGDSKYYRTEDEAKAGGDSTADPASVKCTDPVYKVQRCENEDENIIEEINGSKHTPGEKVSAKYPTTEADGNVAYYPCINGDAYYDAAGIEELTNITVSALKDIAGGGWDDRFSHKIAPMSFPKSGEISQIIFTCTDDETGGGGGNLVFEAVANGKYVDANSFEINCWGEGWENAAVVEKAFGDGYSSENAPRTQNGHTYTYKVTNDDDTISILLYDLTATKELVKYTGKLSAAFIEGIASAKMYFSSIHGKYLYTEIQGNYDLTEKKVVEHNCVEDVGEHFSTASGDLKYAYVTEAKKGSHTPNANAIYKDAEGKEIDYSTLKCTDTAYVTTTCDVCGEKLADQEINGLIHTPSETRTEAVSPTATANGNVAYYGCTNEDAYFAEPDVTKELANITVPALKDIAGGGWDDRFSHKIVPMSFPKSGEISQIIFTCTDDETGGGGGNLVFEAVANGKYVDANSFETNCWGEGWENVDAVEKAFGDGYSGENAPRTQKGHTYTYKVTNDDNTISILLYDLTDTKELVKYTGKLSAAFIESIASAKMYFSSIHGKYLYTEIQGDYNLKKGTVTAPTCTKAGTEPYKTDDGAFVYNVVTAATGHKNITKHDEVAATCTVAGKKAYWTCENESGVLYVDAACTTTTTESDLAIPAGHKLGDKVAATVTCTEAGNLEHYQCTVCRVYFKDPNATETLAKIESPALGHSYGSDTKYKDASGKELSKEQFDALTCKETAYTEGTCTKCGYVSKGDPVTGKIHAEGVKSVTKKASKGDPGVLSTKCPDCNKELATDVIYGPETITLEKTSYEYTGKAIEPAVTTVLDSNNKEIGATNYTVSYSKNTEVGIATVKVTFKEDSANYSGSLETTFEITEKQGGQKPGDGDQKPDDGDKKPDDGDKKPDDGDKTPAATLTLNKTTVTLYTGKVSKNVTIKPTVTGASKTVTWKTDKPKVAKVDKNGKITAVGKGTATITATANGISKTVKVTVKNPTLTIKKGSKKFTKSKLTVNKKKKVTLTVTVSPKNSGISIAKLTAKQKKIASVTLKSGKITIKGKKKGSFTLQIKSGKTTKKIKITVK